MPIRTIIGLFPEEELQIVLRYLNADRRILRRAGPEDLDTVAYLRDWIKRWQDSGPNMGRFVRENPELWKGLLDHGVENPPYILALRDGDGIVLGWPLPRVVKDLHAVTVLSAVLAAPILPDAAPLLPGHEETPPSPEAFFLFLSFLGNPLRRRLGGPCARCGHYFLRRTERNPKVYCSRLCGSRTTGTAAIKQQRQKDHADKLQRARDAAQEWSKARPGEDWKSWVSARQLDISAKFLTRAVHNGEMKPPTKRGKR